MPSHQRLLLAVQPVGIPGPANFIADVVPTRPPGRGEVLLETISLSDYAPLGMRSRDGE